MAKKLIALLLAVLMAVTVLAGCTEQRGQQGTEGELIVINYPTYQCGVNTSAATTAKRIEEFNKKFAGKYEIKLEEVPGDENYGNKMRLLLGTGDLPPVITSSTHGLLDLLVERDLLVDLTPYVEADPEWKALFTDASIEINTRNGKLYGSSEQSSPIGYFYNKELFKQAGIEAPAKTWDEFFAQCDTLKAAGITPLAMDTADSAWVTTLWMGAMIATSGDEGLAFMKTRYPKDYSLDCVRDAAAKIQKILQEYTTQDAIGGKYENAANNFLTGNAAMLANGPWMIGDFSDTTKTTEDFAEKVGTAIYPGGFVYDAPSTGYYVTKQKDPKLVEAAVEMVKYFTSAQSQELCLEMQGIVPSAPSVEVSDKVKDKFPVLAAFLDVKKTATISSDNLQATMFPNLYDVFSRELPRLYSGDIDAASFCQILTEEATKNK